VNPYSESKVEVLNFAPRPYGLTVLKRLINQGDSSNRNFVFQLETAVKYAWPGEVVRLKWDSDEHVYKYDTNGNATFAINMDEGKSLGSAEIDGLPAGFYRVVEVTEGYEPTYAYYAYETVPGNPNNPNGANTGLQIHKGLSTAVYLAEVTNHIYGLEVVKQLHNQVYAENRRFTFGLWKQNDLGAWIPLKLREQSNGNFAYDETGGKDTFTIDVPRPEERPVPTSAAASVRITDLPNGVYRGVEQGNYRPTYAYTKALTESADAVSVVLSETDSNAGIETDAGFAVHKAIVTNYYSEPSDGDTPTTPTTPTTPVTPVVPPGVTPAAPVTPPTTPVTPGTPGGTDPSVPPTPMAPGSSLVPIGDGGFVEIGEDGTPLGEWHWDDPTQQWIFYEYPPLGDLPQTGFQGAIANASRTVYPFVLLITLLLLLSLLLPSVADWRAKRRKQWF
jgi:hypothetical protein